MMYSDDQIEAALEAAVKVAMIRQQVDIIFKRLDYGDLTADEAAIETVHAYRKIMKWSLEDDYPFGEYEE